ncbi:alcohol acetyltransferase-domain-containing protein [Astrocystis sublimbata]|nr:alcohol acetyltransferase-domain-containing protein [Astrocystis sublimbata]
MADRDTKAEMAPNMDLPLKPLRQLGGNEAYQLAMYILDQYRGTSVSCRYTIPHDLVGLEARAELRNTVEAAIVDVVLKHGVLQLGIIKSESSKPAWVQLRSLDLDKHVQWRFIDESTDFDAASRESIEFELDAPFPDLDTQPGWRVTVLQKSSSEILEIIFNWNHPHCDGVSGKIFHRHLYKSLNSPREATTAEESVTRVVQLPESTPNVTPPIDHIMPLPLELRWTISTVWEENKPKFLWRSPYQADWAPITTSPYKTQFRVFTLDNAILANLLTVCRAHHTTLTGLFHGITLVSLATRLEKQAATAFRGVTTVDLRRFLPRNPPKHPWLEPEESIGNYVTQLNHDFDPPLVSKVRSLLTSKDAANENLSADVVDLVWSAAAKVRGEIMQKLETGVKNDIVGTLKFVPDWRSQMKQAAKRPRPASWMITGLGALENEDFPDKASEDKAWTLRRAQFALSAETTAAAIMISPMSVAGECLSVGGSWQDCIFDVTLGEGVMDDLERWLRQLGA